MTDAALSRRLAAYAATIGFSLVLSPEADAQVVYTDIDPDLVVSADEAVLLDIDDDGLADFNLVGRSGFAAMTVNRSFYIRRAPGAATQNRILNEYDYTASRLGSTEAIGPVAQPRRFNTIGNLAYRNYSYMTDGNFVGEEGYLGFRFVAGDGARHYGWIRLSINHLVTEAILYESAYEATPEATILTGDRNAIIALSGTVNQTVFPAEGDTLRFTATVANGFSRSAPLDLWVEASQERVIRYTRMLASGVLPSGTTVTRTLEVQVGSGAPAGQYDVTFKLGDFSRRRAIEAETFVLTKTASLGAPGDAEAFTAEAVAGDLFAQAEAEAASVGTHLLSAPTPNPSTGRTALTLEVAEMQAVRVAVYDALGREVAVLHDGPMAAGAAHRLVFDGAALPAGVYAVRAMGETFSDVRTLTLIR